MDYMLGSGGETIVALIFIVAVFYIILCISICNEGNEPTNDITHIRNPSSNANISPHPNGITLISNIKCLLKGDCPICIEPFKEGDELYRLRCGHIYHTECIEEWININRICPTCRNTIIGDDIV